MYKGVKGVGVAIISLCSLPNLALHRAGVFHGARHRACPAWALTPFVGLRRGGSGRCSGLPRFQPYPDRPSGRCVFCCTVPGLVHPALSRDPRKYLDALLPVAFRDCRRSCIRKKVFGLSSPTDRRGDHPTSGISTLYAQKNTIISRPMCQRTLCKKRTLSRPRTRECVIADRVCHGDKRIRYKLTSIVSTAAVSAALS